MQITKSLLHTTDAYIKKLREAGIESVTDFLSLFPRGYEDKSEVIEQFSLLNVQEKQVVKCKIELLTEEQTRNKKLLIKAVLTDRDGIHAEAVWWNRRMLLTQYSQWDIVLIYGQPKYDYGRLSFNSSDIEHYREKRREIVPIYSDVNYIPGTWIREKMLFLKNFIEEIPDTIPREIRLKKWLSPRTTNIRNIHFPQSIEDFDRARTELGYEELFHFQMVGVEKKYSMMANSEWLAPATPLDTDLIKSLIADLPFPLTNKQKIVLFQILKDMEKPHAMARLLQGDVGTGKTVVAMIAAIHIIKSQNLIPHLWEPGSYDLKSEFSPLINGTESEVQVAIMAPTEILARQHFAGNEAWLMKWWIRSDLLVGSLTPRMKEDARERLRSGQTDIVFGTHALIQDSVQFARLGFVVVDEQHRFGVEQRKALEEYCSSQVIKLSSNQEWEWANKELENLKTWKLSQKSILPHRLNMSATPIPRTLALTIYGDQDVSVLDEYPVGRKPIHTRVVREDQRIEMYRFIEEQVREGRQVYWISPLVDGLKKQNIAPDEGKKNRGSGMKTVWERKENDIWWAERTSFFTPETFDTFGLKSISNSWWNESKEDIASAVEMQITLSAIFPKLTIGLIHGKMSGKEKDRVMQEFYENKIHILSSTSVVEVGVNNPNATVMCIEAAERFGLSQLHQFRGRVGRGEHQSYCYLFTTKEYKTDRLRAMEQTNDGFELAEIDLELRGPGEVYGVRQSGVPDFHFADLRDVNLISEIQEDIEEWMKWKKNL